MSIKSIKRFSNDNPDFPEGGMRWRFFNRETNGFERAFLRDGGRIFVDEDVFFQCIRDKNVHPTAETAA